MPDPFREISPQAITDNVFALINDDWMLITAGSLESFNPMTASWGGLGVLWDKPIAICFIRPSRYTYHFMEGADAFTLSFFGEEHRDVLDFCGSHTGREVDKVAETGLTPLSTETGAVTFAEARLVLECRKVYYQDFNPAHFLDAAIHDAYPSKDYHRMYIGEIVRCLAK